MKLLQKLFLFVLVVVVLLIGGLWAGVHYYGGEIKGLVIEEVNEQLRTKIDVKSVEISFWKHFPQTSVVFNETVIYSVNSKTDTLLYAEKLSATFSLIDLYRKDYTLRGLQIENGFCRMKRYGNKQTNYIFWDEKEATTESNFSVDLQKVQLSNMEYAYLDQPNAVTVKFSIENAALSGNFKQTIFKLNIKSTLKNSFIKNSDFTFIKDKTLFVYSKAAVNGSEGSIRFTDANLGIEGMNFALKGEINYGDTPYLNLEMNSTNTKLDKAVQLLPNKIKKGLENYEIDGNAEINGSINGPMTAIDQPSYSFNFAIINGRFEDNKNNLLFKNSTLNGNINNGNANKSETSEIILSKIKTNFNGGDIDGTLSLKNFSSPQYRFNGKMNFKLKDAITLFNWKDLNSVEGSIAARLNLSGRLNKIDRYELADWKRSKIKGTLELKNVGFYYRDGPQHIHNINGTFQLKNNTLIVDALTASINSSKLNLNGSFNNLVGYLVEEDETLIVDASLKSPYIQLEDFLAANSKNKDTTAFQLKISPQLKIYLHTSIAALSFKKFNLKNLNGDFVVRNQQIDGRNLSFQTLEGKAGGSFFIKDNNNKLNTYARLSVNQININQLFYTFDNFGQKTLKHENISGIATADIEYSCEWSKNLIPDLSSLKVSSDLFIEKGNLINFKPLEQLSSYISLQELKKVKFKNLSNQILIRDETVIIPKFEVHSSALNIDIQGKHQFDNKIDYRFTLLLNELLGKKVKKPKQNDFGYIEDDGLGRTKIFVKMTGTADDPEFSYDKQALKDHLKSEVKKEKKTVKSLLNKEFGLFKNDSSIKNNSPTQDKREKRPFEIEWEENKDSTINQESNNANQTENSEETNDKKGKFGKFIDRIAKPNENEYEDK